MSLSPQNYSELSSTPSVETKKRNGMSIWRIASIISLETPSNGIGFAPCLSSFTLNQSTATLQMA
ncbi:hypothetical protein CKO09_04515 [Chromatium weissei]|nr:hypothetical protein [Chromatium weissei]